MKNKFLTSLFTVFSFFLSAQSSATVKEPILIESKNGIESYRSAGFENPSVINPNEIRETPVFDPISFIEDASNKIKVHIENGNVKEAEILKKEIENIKEQYNIK